MPAQSVYLFCCTNDGNTFAVRTFQNSNTKQLLKQSVAEYNRLYQPTVAINEDKFEIFTDLSMSPTNSIEIKKIFQSFINSKLSLDKPTSNNKVKDLFTNNDYFFLQTLDQSLVDSFTSPTKRKRVNTLESESSAKQNKAIKISEESNGKKANKKQKNKEEARHEAGVRVENNKKTKEGKKNKSNTSQEELDVNISLSQPIGTQINKISKKNDKKKVKEQEILLTQQSDNQEECASDQGNNNINNDEINGSDIVYDMSHFPSDSRDEFIKVAENLRQYRITHKEEREMIKEVLVKLKDIVENGSGDKQISSLIDCLCAKNMGKIKKEILKIQSQLQMDLTQSSELNSNGNIKRYKKSDGSKELNENQTLSQHSASKKTPTNSETKEIQLKKELEIVETSENNKIKKSKKSIEKKKEDIENHQHEEKSENDIQNSVDDSQSDLEKNIENTIDDSESKTLSQPNHVPNQTPKVKKQKKSTAQQEIQNELLSSGKKIESKENKQKK